MAAKAIKMKLHVAINLIWHIRKKELRNNHSKTVM